MITDVPTADDFYKAGLGQLYLAWVLTMIPIRDLDDSIEQALEAELPQSDIDEMTKEFWSRQQPALANALGLVQQAAEMALKSRIAAVSPFILIVRDKEWPAPTEGHSTPFSQFRTLDAAELFKVHNTVAATPLPQSFQNEWDALRRERNKIMHSVAGRTFEAGLVVRAALFIAKSLFTDKVWPSYLIELGQSDVFTSYLFYDDYCYNNVMRQVASALDLLAPRDQRDLLGFDKNEYAFACPECVENANRDNEGSWPKLAQLLSRDPDERKLHCIVCDHTLKVTRERCRECNATVHYKGDCLSCLADG